MRTPRTAFAIRGRYHDLLLQVAVAAAILLLLAGLALVAWHFIVETRTERQLKTAEIFLAPVLVTLGFLANVAWNRWFGDFFLPQSQLMHRLASGQLGKTGRQRLQAEARAAIASWGDTGRRDCETQGMTWKSLNTPTIPIPLIIPLASEPHNGSLYELVKEVAEQWFSRRAAGDPGRANLAKIYDQGNINVVGMLRGLPIRSAEEASAILGAMANVVDQYIPSAIVQIDTYLARHVRAAVDATNWGQRFFVSDLNAAESGDPAAAYAVLRDLADDSLNRGLVLRSSVPIAPIIPVPRVSPTFLQQRLDSCPGIESGRRIVIYGPPGAGKSQTAELIAAQRAGAGEVVLHFDGPVDPSTLQRVQAEQSHEYATVLAHLFARELLTETEPYGIMRIAAFDSLKEFILSHPNRTLLVHDRVDQGGALPSTLGREVIPDTESLQQFCNDRSNRFSIVLVTRAPIPGIVGAHYVECPLWTHQVASEILKDWEATTGDPMGKGDIRRGWLAACPQVSLYGLALVRLATQVDLVNRPEAVLRTTLRNHLAPLQPLIEEGRPLSQTIKLIRAAVEGGESLDEVKTLLGASSPPTDIVDVFGRLAWKAFYESNKGFLSAPNLMNWSDGVIPDIEVANAFLNRGRSIGVIGADLTVRDRLVADGSAALYLQGSFSRSSDQWATFAEQVATIERRGGADFLAFAWTARDLREFIEMFATTTGTMHLALAVGSYQSIARIAAEGELEKLAFVLLGRGREDPIGIASLVARIIPFSPTTEARLREAEHNSDDLMPLAAAVAAVLNPTASFFSQWESQGVQMRTLLMFAARLWPTKSSTAIQAQIGAASVEFREKVECWRVWLSRLAPQDFNGTVTTLGSLDCAEELKLRMMRELLAKGASISLAVLKAAAKSAVERKELSLVAPIADAILARLFPEANGSHRWHVHRRIRALVPTEPCGTGTARGIIARINTHEGCRLPYRDELQGLDAAPGRELVHDGIPDHFDPDENSLFVGGVFATANGQLLPLSAAEWKTQSLHWRVCIMLDE